ncbi:MAG: MFS transporter [Candidatus Omnitrophota bacterium]
MSFRLDKTKALVALVYFLQGFGLANLVFSLFLKETLRWSVLEITWMGTITAVPWFFKILYGVLSDNFPLFGYKRKSYLAAGSVLSVLCWAALAAFRHTGFWYFTWLFFLSNVAACTMDVIIDGYVVQQSTDLKKTNAYQNLSWGSRAVGAGISSSLGGWLAAHFGVYEIFWMQVPIVALQMPLALLLDETRAAPGRTHGAWRTLKAALMDPLREFVRTPQLLWVTLFTVLALFSPSYGTPFFFRMRDVLHFGPEFIGLLGGIGSAGQIAGCLLFAKFLGDVPIKKLLFVSVFIWAVNTAAVLAIVNGTTAIAVSAVAAVTGYISFVPTFSIAAKICQKTRYEATLFAILMSFRNIAMEGGSLLGSWLYQYTGFFWLVVISTVTTFLVLPVILKLED